MSQSKQVDKLDDLLTKAFFEVQRDSSVVVAVTQPLAKAIRAYYKGLVGEQEKPDKGGAKSRVVAIRNELRKEMIKRISKS